jgi:hypothetical protein
MDHAHDAESDDDLDERLARVFEERGIPKPPPRAAARPLPSPPPQSVPPVAPAPGPEALPKAIPQAPARPSPVAAKPAAPPVAPRRSGRREKTILLAMLGTLAGAFVGVLSMKLLVPRPPNGAGPDIHLESAGDGGLDLVEPPALTGLPPTAAIPPTRSGASASPRPRRATNSPHSATARRPKSPPRSMPNLPTRRQHRVDFPARRPPSALPPLLPLISLRCPPTPLPRRRGSSTIHSAPPTTNRFPSNEQLWPAPPIASNPAGRVSSPRPPPAPSTRNRPRGMWQRPVPAAMSSAKVTPGGRWPSRPTAMADSTKRSSPGIGRSTRASASPPAPASNFRARNNSAPPGAGSCRHRPRDATGALALLGPVAKTIGLSSARKRA